MEMVSIERSAGRWVRERTSSRERSLFPSMGVRWKGLAIGREGWVSAVCWRAGGVTARGW